jgi:hypothetical protein
LARIVDRCAHVADVAVAISIRISLEPIRERRAVVADVADTI